MRRSLIIVFLLTASLLVSFLCASQNASAQQWLPQYDDSGWRNSIPATMRQSYVTYGEQYLGKAWKDLPQSVFSEYKQTGNRTHYESLMLEKRRQLSALVMAEIIEGKGRFIEDIVKGIESTLKEIWWGLPAHYDYDLPRADVQIVDLVNAETGSLLAYTRQILSSQLDSFSSQLPKRIDAEVSRRVLQPALSPKSWWKNATNNWNPWICSNWLACVLFCEQDESRKTEALNQINKACETFYKAYPEDGGCDEGPGYWDRAAASLFEVCYLMELSHNTFFISLADQKLKTMGSYIYTMYAGNGNIINFSDTYGHRASLNVNIAYLYGVEIDDKVLRQYAAWMGKKNDILNNAASIFIYSANWPSVGRELIFLNHINSFLKEKPLEPKLKNVWFPDLQVMTSHKGTSRSFFVAYKGGHNGESHNHNDVGSFIVYSNGEPLFVDLGVSEYNSKTFSKDRYDIWTMQSDYHNLPSINGKSQKTGKQYKAEFINYRTGQLTLDISKAYPDNADVIRWYRTVSTRSNRHIIITEDFELSSFKEASQIYYITPIKPEIVKAGQVVLNDCSIHFNPSQLSARIEDLSSYIDPMLSRVWGEHMYRIILTVKSHQLKQSLQYYISSNK